MITTDADARSKAYGDPAIRRFMADLLNEYTRARAQYGTYASHHEAYAVLLEEVQECWDEVRKHDGPEDPAALYRELVQVAQVAMAWAVLLTPGDGGGDSDGS